MKKLIKNPFTKAVARVIKRLSPELYDFICRTIYNSGLYKAYAYRKRNADRIDVNYMPEAVYDIYTRLGE